MDKLDDLEEVVQLNLIVDEIDTIQGYAENGNINGAVDWQGILPIEFKTSFKPSYYLLRDNKIVVNPNYIEPVLTKPNTGPTAEQVMINQLGLKYAELSAKVDKLEGGAVNG